MNIEHLGYVLEIFRCQSINRAAKNLFISQPSLSSMLKGLEAEIGYKIFERTSAGIRPTEQGEAFYHFAERVYGEYAKMKAVPTAAELEENLSITSACSSFYAHAFFAFKREFPAARPTRDVFREATIYESLHDIIANRTRLVITYFSQKHAKKYEMYARKFGLLLHRLRDGLPVRVIVARDHPLAQRGVVDFRELQEYPFVTYHDIDYEDILGLVHVPEDADVQYVTSRATFYNAIQMGNYISISLEIAPEEAERMGCVSLPCRHDDDTYVAAYFVKAQYLPNEREKAFLQYLSARLERIYA